MYAIASLLFVVVISLLVTRVATVILVATGLSRQSAKFQARSALTGAGFTTSESERVVDHPLRRRVIMALMLLGNAGIVAGAGSLILGFQSGSAGYSWVRVIELLGGLTGLIVLSRNAAVDRQLTRLIGRILRRYTDLPTRDLDGLLDLSRDYSVIELAVRPGDWVADQRLADLGLREEGLVVLGITRADGHFRGAPVGRTMVQEGDTLILYGRAEDLREIDHRTAGAEGDASHDLAVERHNEMVDREESDEHRHLRALGATARH